MESHFKCSLPAILQPVEWSPFDICGTIEAISFESPQVHISEFLGFRLPTWIECYSMSWCIFYFARPWLIGINVSFDYDEIFIKWKLHSNYIVWVCSYIFSNLLICGFQNIWLQFDRIHHNRESVSCTFYVIDTCAVFISVRKKWYASVQSPGAQCPLFFALVVSPDVWSQMSNVSVSNVPVSNVWDSRELHF